MVKKNILILGSSGLLGNYLLNRFKLLNKFSVFGFARSIHGELSEIYLTKIINKNNINIVINCIAQTNVDLCEKNPLLAFKDNVLSSIIILNSLKNINKKINLIHISTDHLYNDQRKSIETNKVKLFNNYAKTKYISELFFLKYKNTVILRTNFFHDQHNKGLNKFIYNSILNKKFIKLYSDVIFSPVHIETLFKAILEVCFNFKKGLFNIACNDKLSKLEYGYKLIKILNLDKKYINETKYYSNRNKIKRPLNMSMSSKKFTKIYNFKFDKLDEEIKKIL